MNLKEDIKPITHLKNKTADLVNHVSDTGRTVVITQDREAKVVVMDVKTYDRWRRAMALPKLAAQAQANVQAGRTMSQEKAFAAAEAAIERSRR